jgi:hypothetical protein
MKRLGSLRLLSLTIVGLLLAATAANADPLSLTFTPAASQSGEDGETLTFDVTAINNSLTDVVNFNSDSLNINPVGNDLAPNDEFFANAPFFLNPGDSSEYEAFTVFIPDGTPAGLYTGSYVILGGPTDSDFDEVGSADFDIQVTPEPSSLLLLLTGMAGLAGTLRRRMAR